MKVKRHGPRCRVCRRVLTDAASIRRGIGPCCQKKRIKRMQIDLFSSDLTEAHGSTSPRCFDCKSWKPIVKPLPGGAAWIGRFGICSIIGAETTAYQTCQDHEFISPEAKSAHEAWSLLTSSGS